MDGKGGRRGRSFAWEVGSLFFFFHFLPAVLRLLVGHQGSLLRDGIKRMAGRDFGLVWQAGGYQHPYHIILCCGILYRIHLALDFRFILCFSIRSSSFLSSPISVYRPRPFLSKLRARQPGPARDRKDGNSGSGWA